MTLRQQRELLEKEIRELKIEREQVLTSIDIQIRRIEAELVKLDTEIAKLAGERLNA